MPDWTRMRLAQTQVWPPLRNFEIMTASIARSRSASSKTMKGALPPSSRLRRLIESAAPRIRSDPTRVEPVKEILRTVSDSSKALPIPAGMPVTMLTTPAGMPARSARTPSASAEKGVNSDGLMTTVQPAASAGATLRVIMAFGKFHGVMMPQTPTASLRTRMRRSGVGDGIVVPPMRRASSANHLTKLAP